MALRPILTTGIALASAGAIVAATPALVTTPGIAVAATDSAVVESKRTVTVDQLNLLALRDINLQTLTDIFFRVDGWGGHVGSTWDPYYSAIYGAIERDEDGNPILDEDGNTIPLNQAGDIYVDGLVGIAYYLGDQILDEVIQSNLPIFADGAQFFYDAVNPYFFELGWPQAVRTAVSELTGGPNAPIGQALAVAESLLYTDWIGLTGTVLTSAAFAVPFAGPDLAAATNILFFGGNEDLGFRRDYAQGIDGIINYVVDRLQGAPAWTGGPVEEDTPPPPAPSPSALLASASKALPSAENLVDVDLETEDADESDADGSSARGAKSVATVETVAVEKTVAEEEVAEEKTPADETGTDGDATGDDAEAGDPEPEAAAKPKRSTKPKLNEKRDNSPAGAEKTESADSDESTSGGKHRAEDKKPGSWKVGDKKDDTKTDGGSTGGGTDRGGDSGGDDE